MVRSGEVFKILFKFQMKSWIVIIILSRAAEEKEAIGYSLVTLGQ